MSSLPKTASSTRWLQWIAGFFLSFRICVIFLAFQSAPQTGTMLILICDFALLLAGWFLRVGDPAFSIGLWMRLPVIRWLLAFLTLSGCSLLWTQAKSPAIAACYWAGMAAEVFIAIFLLGDAESAGDNLRAMMKGYIMGACAVALVVWCAPSMPDLRLGNNDFLNPNGIGFEFAVAAFCAQFLATREPRWKWQWAALVITLLRTISKTSILAYFTAEFFYLLSDREMRPRTKVYICSAGVVAFACFSTLFMTYLANYTGPDTHDQAETLTGRTWIWAVSLTMAIERPLFGYGVYAYRSVIPAFGDFEPWHAHNEFIQQFFEYGAAGVALLLGIYRAILRTARQAMPGALRTLTLALFVFAIIHGLADTISFGFSFSLWMLTALAIALAADPSQKEFAA